MKRSQPVLHLSRSPLVYTVLQVGISPVFSIRNYLPELQENLRKKGFPRYREGSLQKVMFSSDGVPPKVESSARYEFYDKTAKTGIMIVSDAITVHTNAYTDFEQFDQAVRLAVDVVQQIAGVELVERVGLRYVDWIQADSEHSVSSLVQPGLRGIDISEIGGREATSNVQVMCLTEVGRMVVRYYQQRGQVLPFDLGVVNLASDLQVAPNQLISLLDLDHFAEQSFEFDVDLISELGWKLHDSLELAFKKAVTDEALTFWGAEYAQF